MLLPHYLTILIILNLAIAEPLPRLTPRMNHKFIHKTLQTLNKLLFFVRFEPESSTVPVTRPAYGAWDGEEWRVRLDVYHTRKPSNRFLPTAIAIDVASQLLIWFAKPQDQFLELKDQRRLVRDLGLNLLAEPVQGNQHVLEVSKDCSGSSKSSFITVLDGAGLPQRTDFLGNLHGYAKLPTKNGIMDGLSTDCIQELQICSVNGIPAFSTSPIQLIPPQGLTILSDVDDILRVAKIWDMKKMIEYMFMRPLEPWLNMPSIFMEWQQQYPETHFHYDSLVPEPFHTIYADFLQQFYPIGTFNSRAWGLLPGGMVGSSLWRTLSVSRVLDDFPDRRFVLLGDTSNEEIIDVFTKLATRSNVACILLRDVSRSEAGSGPGINLDDVQILDVGTRQKFTVYGVPDELLVLNLAKPNCH